MMMSFTITRAAFAQPLDGPGRVRRGERDVDRPGASKLPLWMCAPVASADAGHVERVADLAFALAEAEGRGAPCRPASAGSGCSATPSMFTVIDVMPLPLEVGSSSVFGHVAGAGMMSAGFAVYVFSCFEPTAMTRWYGSVFEPTLWQTAVFACAFSCDACATPNEPRTSSGTARSSNLRIRSLLLWDRHYEDLYANRRGSGFTLRCGGLGEP